MAKLKVFDGLKTDWEGLWYHPESNVYSSKVFSLATLREFKGNVQIIVIKNKYYKKGTNRPSFEFLIQDSSWSKSQEFELSEDSDDLYINLSDAIEIARNMIYDAESGYSTDDLVVEVERFMTDKAVSAKDIS